MRIFFSFPLFFFFSTREKEENLSVIDTSSRGPSRRKWVIFRSSGSVNIRVILKQQTLTDGKPMLGLGKSKRKAKERESWEVDAWGWMEKETRGGEGRGRKRSVTCDRQPPRLRLILGTHLRISSFHSHLLGFIWNIQRITQKQKKKKKKKRRER